MPNKVGRTTEYQMSLAVMQIAATKPGGCATLDELRSEIPSYIALTPGDNDYSSTRPGERMWEQLLRNIQSHHNSKSNFIQLGLLDHVAGGGYAITDAGRDLLDRAG